MEYFKEFIKFISPANKNDKCTCLKNNEDYCDNISTLLKLTKNNNNFDKEKARRLYEVFFYN